MFYGSCGYEYEIVLFVLYKILLSVNNVFLSSLLRFNIWFVMFFLDFSVLENVSFGGCFGIKS